MDKFFDSMLQEIDRYTGTVNLEGENIIPGCREMMNYLKGKMIGKHSINSPFHSKNVILLL